MIDLEGRTFGPRTLAVTADRVASYVETTGDDRHRWSSHAPPGFSSAALFVVAPELLALLSGRSVVHGEQTFAWDRPIPAGSEMQVSGTVSRVRERGGVVYVGFDLSARDDAGVVLSGSSLFLLSGQNPPLSAEASHPEPAHDDDGHPSNGERSASRASLIRYAAATGDWNPVHWDHAAAVEAGFPGVVVHGLLQAAWAIQVATAARSGHRPLASARFRFRSPLRPAHPVATDGTLEDSVVTVSVSDERQEYLSGRIELADG